MTNFLRTTSEISYSLVHQLLVGLFLVVVIIIYTTPDIISKLIRIIDDEILRHDIAQAIYQSRKGKD